MEAAIAIPVLAMLLFGMLTGGLALSQKNSVANAAREASRFGATRPIEGTTQAWLDSVASVAMAAGTGDLDATAPNRYICVALSGTGATDGRKEITASGTSYSGGSCPGISCPSGAPCVQVVLSRRATLDAILVKMDLTVKGTGVSVWEREKS